ncbi:hypothetical protein GCM10011375_05040 [Hymenobacter qilianensis]|uniref:Uncharacterized protein n=2 Tax=Hymenobacter qilianensis TaxID=1385715 RepID=A0ACB5PMI4_9BACT|nr:hypothetical protein [Hymenobacter qilianensis]QNP53847.1 hypothetical protein H9L05_10120 [Hymenobacter qilianensis]GGF52561.1 hypothetical protein GCM10011375_05040 [Hymenobacter qilianensis]
MLITQQSQTQQEYGTAKGWRLFMYILAPPLIILFLSLPFWIGWNEKQIGFSIGFSALMIAMAGLFIYGLLETIKARHIITADKLIYAGVFRRKELPLANIKGYRIDQHYIRVFPKSTSDPKIQIGYTSENYAGLQEWFADHYPDLDIVEQEQEAAQALEDHDLGRTPAERQETLEKAQRTAKWLNIAGGIVAVWLLFRPQPYQWAMAAGLVVPLLAIVASWIHQGAIRVDGKENSVYPGLTTAITGPVLILLARVLLDFEILEYGPLWPQAGGVALIVALILLVGSRTFLAQNESRISLLFAILFISVSYGFAGTLAYNCAFDDGQATKYEAQVLSKHVSSGKTTTYYLEVAPWGPRTTNEDVTVTKDYYKQTEVGDTVSIYAMPGQLKVPWFTVDE